MIRKNSGIEGGGQSDHHEEKPVSPEQRDGAIIIDAAVEAIKKFSANQRMGFGVRDVLDSHPFSPEEQREIALKLIKAGGGACASLVGDIYKFKGLDCDVAIALIEAGYGWAVGQSLHCFQGIDHKEIALKIIEAGQGKNLMFGPESFENLDCDVANKLIEANLTSVLDSNLEYFQNLDDNVAAKLIKAGDGYRIARYISNFDEAYHNDIALKILGAKEGAMRETLAAYLDYFKHLSIDVARRLCEMGAFGAVGRSIKSFISLDREIALKLIEAIQGDRVAQNIECFEEGDHSAIALKLIETGGSDFLIDNLSGFKNLNSEVALKLIEAGMSDHVAFALSKFQSLDHEVAFKLIEAIQGSRVVDFIDRFKNIDHREVALRLIEARQWYVVAEHFQVFHGDIFKKAQTSRQDVMLDHVEFIVTYLKADLMREGEKPPFESLPPEERYRSIADKLIEAGVWNDEQNISGPFRAGAEIFGYERMFRYLNRENLSRHDGLHAFNAIINLFNDSGLSADDFYAKILDQVSRDGGNYDSGTAHHELNQVAMSFDGNLAENLEKATHYPNIPNLQELASQLSSPAEVFASWKNLRRYNELTKLLGKTELLEGLESEPNEKMRKYVSELAFHPDGNVDMQKVFEFWHDPQIFLDLPDSHTPEEIHNRKKPSNLAEIPNLDLTPEDLRDALVDGSLDRIQAFAPMSVEYTIGYSLREEVSKALGSYREKVSGLAGDPKKLFGEIAAVLKSAKITVQQFLAGEVVPPEAEEEIRALLLKSGLGLSESTRKKFPAYRIVMRTNAKSDPQGVLAGNDTACCMPFGSGKNNVYTWNPACTLATLEIERPDGGRRTIAQSVLTKDRDIGKNVAEVVALLRAEGEAHLQDVLSEDVLRASPAVVACDNIEVAPNYKGEEYKDLIRVAYQDFFTEYLRRYGREQGFADDRIVIGLGYSDALTDLPKVSNTTVPEAPVGYSDKTHEQCYELSLKPDLKAKLAVLRKEVTVPQEISAVSKKKGGDVSPLTFEDTMATAYIEGKAYAGNESLMEYMWKIENTLIAKDINNAAKARPNMSFKYERDGKMRGYLVAYEGKLGNNEEEMGVETAVGGESIIYIADLAVAEPGTLGGGRAGASLVGSFVEHYGNEYLKNGNFIPVFAYAREQTSYKLILKELKRYEKEFGIEFVVEEGESYQVGSDTMHPVIMRPKPLEEK